EKILDDEVSKLLLMTKLSDSDIFGIGQKIRSKYPTKGKYAEEIYDINYKKTEFKVENDIVFDSIAQTSKKY
ncbi:MAG: hypothetical protein RR957_06220, partial [Oscillospiraceae bacterium]